MFADVERPVSIRAQWLDYNGVAHDEQLDGLLATCLQHELDHLDGILFIDHLSWLKRDMLLKKLDHMRKVNKSEAASDGQEGVRGWAESDRRKFDKNAMMGTT